MHYLVDGNNVMAQRIGWHKDKRAARKGLIQDLSRFIAVHRGKIKVVFDGRPDEEFPDGTRYKSVQILYARYGSDADCRIKEIIHGASYRRDMVVVSSDRDLVSFASRQGTRTISSGRFRKMLDSAGKTRTEKEKPLKGESVDIDDWLNYFEKTKS